MKLLRFYKQQVKENAGLVAATSGGIGVILGMLLAACGLFFLGFCSMIAGVASFFYCMIEDCIGWDNIVADWRKA